MSRQGISSRMEHPPLNRGENTPIRQEATPTPSVSYAQPQPASVTPRHSEHQARRPKGLKKLNKKFITIGAAIVAAVLLIAVLSSLLLPKSDGLGEIDGSRYQAVFFTNGQVYFGKLHSLGGGYMKLTDIFYLQTKTQSNSKNPQETDQESDPGVDLIKLGNEIHGPEDAMIISKEQVLFFENLKDDGKVSQTIKGYRPS